MEGLQLTNFRAGSQAIPKTSLFPKSSLDHSLEMWVGMGRFPSFFIFHREGGRFLHFRRRSMLDFLDALSRFPKQGGTMSLIGDIGKKDQNLSSVPFPLFQRVWPQDVTGGIKKVVLKSWSPGKPAWNLIWKQGFYTGNQDKMRSWVWSLACMTQVFINRGNVDIERDAQRGKAVWVRGECCMTMKVEMGVCCHKPRNTWG